MAADGPALCALVAFTSGLTLEAAITIYVTVLALSCVYGLVAVWRLSGRSRPHVAFDSLPQVLRFGAAVVTGNVLLVLMYRLDYLLLGNLAGYADVGRYAVATTVAEVFLLLPQSLGTVVFPKVSASTPEQAAATAAKSVGVSLLLSICSVALGLIPVLFLLGPLFGPAYESARIPILLLMPGVIGMSLAYVIFQYYSGIGKPSIPAMLLGVAVVVNVILNLFLIPAFGAPGAAVASSIAYLLAGVGGALVFQQSDLTSHHPIWKLPIRDTLRGLRSLRMNKIEA